MWSKTTGRTVNVYFCPRVPKNVQSANWLILAVYNEAWEKRDELEKKPLLARI